MVSVLRGHGCSPANMATEYRGHGTLPLQLNSTRMRRMLATIEELMPDFTYHAIAKMIDHSLLQQTLTDAELDEGCALARAYDVASVCIKPYDVRAAARAFGWLNGRGRHHDRISARRPSHVHQGCRGVGRR